MQGFGVTNTKGPLSVEVTEERGLAQVKQLQALTKSQQRQILEHQEALARLHAMIRETQEAQVGELLFASCASFHTLAIAHLGSILVMCKNVALRSTRTISA